ncbi:hypothetical protein C8R43DRAFT_1001475 [Mycena crocata]|nr:hypothetical protein C8R43DRAFT_1001475 [Mycena crocata]
MVVRQAVPFCPAWLKDNEDPIITREQWGEGKSHFWTTDWDDCTFEAKLLSTTINGGTWCPPRISIELRFCFGLLGCVVPLGYMPEVTNKVLAFTIAGVCDSQGNKPVYLLRMWPQQTDDTLAKFPTTFSDLSDFHTRSNEYMMRFKDNKDMVPDLIDIARIPKGTETFRAVDGRLWPARRGGYSEAKDPRWDIGKLLHDMYPSQIRA